MWSILNHRLIKLGKLKIVLCKGKVTIYVFGKIVPEKRVYMKIKVDPLEPSAISTTFYGPTRSVERYRQIYREKIDDWSVNDDIYQNFLRIFGKRN